MRVRTLWMFGLTVSVMLALLLSACVGPAAAPTATPTKATEAPTAAPTKATEAPTAAPTKATEAPTAAPTKATEAPTAAPTKATEAPTAAPTKAAEAKKYDIAVVVKITGIPWFNTMEKGVKKAADALGVNAYQTGHTTDDPAQQAKVIEDLITKGVQAICVVPNDAKSLEPVFKKAKDKGIVIITHESPDQVGNDYDLELIDNKKFGEHNLDMLVKFMGDSGEFAVYVGSLTVPAHNMWADAALAYAKTKYPNLKVVADRFPVAEDIEASRKQALDLFKAYPDLKGILAFGSQGPIGAAQAVQEKGLKDKITVVGTVLPSQALPYLKDGSLKYGTLWNPADAGYGMVWLAKYILDGNKVSDGMDVAGLGKATLKDRVLVIDAALDITKDNAESLGF
jgi:simple sugar transport system substrate-binding protein